MAKGLVYKVKSWRTEEGATVYSVFSCADDVEHRRHRRNPFHVKYLQAVLSTFESIRLADNHGSISRSQVEAASANVHVRMELIKTMKENLAKNTSEAVKHYKGSSHTKGHVDSAVNFGEEKHEKSASRKRWDLECRKDSFFCHDVYEFYLKTYGHYFENLQGKIKQYVNIAPENEKDRISSEEGFIPVNLHTAVPMLENQAKENPSFLQDEALCFNLDKEATETLESLMRFGPTEALILEVNFNGDADIKCFKEHINAVAKELILNGSLFNTEEEYQDTKLIPQEDPQTKCTSVSDKVFDDTVNAGKLSSLEAREQSILTGVLAKNANDNSPSWEHIEKEEFFNSSLRREPFLGYEVQKNGPANHFKHFDLGFTKQTGNQKISGELKQEDGIVWSNSKTIFLEDVDSIEEFDENEPVKFNHNIFTESSSVIENADSYNNYMLGLEGSSSSCQSQETNPVETFGIHMSSMDVAKFRYAKAKKNKKKCQWLVHDLENLLDITEHFDNNSDVDCIPESLLNRIMVCPKMFAESLSRSPMNLVEHRKQLQGSCLKISGVLSFAPKEGNQDFGRAEWNQDINDNENSHLIHDKEQSKLSSENATKHGPILRNLCSETHMLGVDWDDIAWQQQENWSKDDRKPELFVTANVCSVAKNSEMLQQSNCIQDIPVSDFQETEEFSIPTTHVYEKHHMQNSQHFPVQRCDAPTCPTVEVNTINSQNIDGTFKELKDREDCLEGFSEAEVIEDFFDQQTNYAKAPLECPTAEIIPINSEKIDGTFKELKDRQEDCSEEFLEAEDFFDQQTNHSKAPSDISTKCGNIENSADYLPSQHDNFLLDRGIGNTKEICNESSTVQFTSEDVCGVSVPSNSTKEKLEFKNDGQDNNGLKQRKRYCLDDLIADVITNECQFHQKALFHFDLAPLSSSLASQIYSFYHQEFITTIHFKQLLEASKGMIHHGDGMVTEQRYYMALLSLAHQQNIGTFKGPAIEGHQIHLQANSSCSLNEIMIHLEPLLERQDG
ncbi:hypothetical protein SUGI_1045800 [Cryptomeria japonica]|nr:hypothetical protein SUGI_1045800 [Cryptomeria japonica]